MCRKAFEDGKKPRKLAFLTVLSAFYSWQHGVSVHDRVFKTSFLLGCGGSPWNFCSIWSKALQEDEKDLTVKAAPRTKMLAMVGGGVAVVAAIMVVLALNNSTQESADQPRSTQSVVPPEKIVSGGVQRDGIPSIDNPKFVSLEDAALADSELVLGLKINGDVRAYPLKILVWHEIVNDEVGGVPVAVTYCPLCFTNQVFKRTIDNQVVEFGTSGKLYNSNLVMYDRSTESLWSQALAQSIAGEHSGKKLERIPFDVSYFKDWKALYPETKVLSQDTGFGRPYGADPYGDYYTSPDIWFPVSHRDDRLGPKEIVIGFENDGIYRAYRLQEIQDEHVVNDDIGDKPVVLLSLHAFMVRAYDRVTPDGQSLEFRLDGGKITDQMGSVWNIDGEAVEGSLVGTQLKRLPFDEGFWFEWVAFHPETELHN